MSLIIFSTPKVYLVELLTVVNGQEQDDGCVTWYRETNVDNDSAQTIVHNRRVRAIVGNRSFIFLSFLLTYCPLINSYFK
jgi:hypothetical protein